MLTQASFSPSRPGRVVVLGSRGFVAGHLLAQLARDGVPAVGFGSADLDLTAPGADAGLASRLQASDALVFVSALTPDKGKDIATLMRNLRMGEAVAGALAADDRTPCDGRAERGDRAVVDLCRRGGPGCCRLFHACVGDAAATRRAGRASGVRERCDPACVSGLSVYGARRRDPADGGGPFWRRPIQSRMTTMVAMSDVRRARHVRRPAGPAGGGARRG